MKQCACLYKPVLLVMAILAIHQAVPAQRVNVGVWELFDKYTLPDSCVWQNPAELRNETDDDHNGFVDDINGIAFDAQEKIKTCYFYSSVQSRAEYEHGTAVASIICRYNPQVQILGAGFVPTTTRLQQSGLLQLTVHQRLAQLPQELESMRRFISMSVQWMADKQVKVINISWGLSLFHFATINPNLGTDSLERLQNARRWLVEMKKAMQDAIGMHPGILFVAAAGNEGEDIETAMDVPASLQAPNLIVVGGCSSNGNRASFSNYGAGITVYAPAEDISYTGALKMPGSGSGNSLAAPQVTALAAAMLQHKHTISEIKDYLAEKKFISAAMLNEWGPDMEKNNE